MNSRSGHTESKEITAQSFAENVGAVRQQGLLREPVNEMDKKHSESEEQVTKPMQGTVGIVKTTKCCRDGSRLGLGKVMRGLKPDGKGREWIVKKKWCDINVNHPSTKIW